MITLFKALFKFCMCHKIYIHTHTHTHTYIYIIYIYIYIYIYIVIHKQTVLLYHKSSLWLDMRDALSRDGNPLNFSSGRWHTPHICIYIYIYRRCPWCNGYRRRKWTRQHEFKSWTWLIAFHIALILLGKVWIQLFSLQLWVISRAD